MRAQRILRAEFRKLVTTKLPWGFLAVLVLLGAAVGIAVVAGTDAEGAKGFIDTAEDQRSLLAFTANSMMLGGPLGAIIVGREYAHATVVSMFLIAPRRYRALALQYVAAFLAGATLGFAGVGLTILAGAISLPIADQELLLSAATIARLLGAGALAGAAGALLGAGVGALVRNAGGAVTAAMVLLVIAPPVAVQLVTEAAFWTPTTIANVVAGVGDEVTVPAALGALAAWGAIPAAAGLVAVRRRDVI